MKNQTTVDRLIEIAVELAEKDGDLELACNIQQASQNKTPTQIRWELENQDPTFKCSNSDLALQEAERVARQG